MSLGELAADQRAAVTELSHTARVIAPAGSGKTRVLTERARWLVRERGIDAADITLIAYNKRAQQEMAERTADLPGLQVRTLNALALAIVNGTGRFARREDRRRTIEEHEVRRILSRLVSFPKRRNADPVAPWIEALTAVRLGMIDPAVVERRAGGDVDGLTAVAPRYRDELRRQGVADFDEYIVLAVEALRDEPATRVAAHAACQLVLVDEFQDLTPAHLQLVRLLAGDQAAVFAVGDDDQTIYGYNGADPSWLIDFAEFFPGAAEHALTVNYRCPADVVAAADRLVRHNRRRVAKTIRAANTHQGLIVHEAGDDPVGATLAAVREELDRGRQPVDIAVLTRVNSMLAPVQAALVQAGVPVSGGVRAEFLERTAIRAALAWLRLATAEQFRPADLGEALRRPSRSLHPRIAEWVGEQQSVEALRRLAARVTNDKDAQRIEDFATDIERVRVVAERSGRDQAARVLRTVRDGIGLGTSVAGLDRQRHGMNRAAQSDDLTALVQLAQLHGTVDGFERWLTDTFSAPWTKGGVALATVHRVKGLEWPAVIVHHATSEQFPHRLAEDVEEERRVFHVALTRGRERVHVVVADPPSPFVAEMSTEPPAGGLPVARTVPLAPVARRADDDMTVDQRAVFEGLKELRRHLAAGKPAYVVFADAVLAAIARDLPADRAALGRIKGVGPAKLDQYGDAVLALVAEARTR
jgi:DNA helicase-2/ATP-dependent DNA helicase PcrA